MATTKKTLKKDMEENVRRLPNNPETERALLACIINGSEELRLKIIRELEVDDFYVEAHKGIFECMQELHADYKPIDIITLFNTLETKGKLEEVGGFDYLSQIRMSVPSTTNYQAYLDLVKRDSKLRHIISIGQTIVNDAMSGSDSDECLKRAEDSIFEMSRHSDERGFIHIADASRITYFDMVQNVVDKGSKSGLKTGFYGLDRVTNGFGKNALVILAARPSVGKTSFAMNIVDNVAKSGKTVAVFSLEMSAEQLSERMMSSNANLSMTKVRSGELDSKDLVRLMEVQKKISKENIYIHDLTDVTPVDIRARCRELKRSKGLDLIMIDYLQLMNADYRKGDNRQQELASITRTLKVTAMELQVPILLLSQLSREIEKRTDHRPQLSDLRDSGAIEQDADIVMFLHDPERYSVEQDKVAGAKNGKAKAEPPKPKKPGAKFKEILLVLAKNRNGELKDIKLKFDSEITTFRSMTGDSKEGSLYESEPWSEKSKQDSYMDSSQLDDSIYEKFAASGDEIKASDFTDADYVRISDTDDIGDGDNNE